MDIEIVGRLLSTLPEDDDHPYRTGAWHPQNTEWRATDMVVEGDIPDDLDGVYLRNTENPLHPAMKRYHPFDGDGMLHAIGFRDGRAFYSNKFVRTDAMLAEQQAGAPLWAGLAERPGRRGWGARHQLKDASSTDVVVHNGFALSTHFECGEGYRMDPVTLDPHGKAPWVPERGTSAHPKLDEHTGELMFFNYSVEEPFLNYGVVDSTDTLVHYVPVELPGPRIPHDMAFTENYAILNDCPLFWEPDLIPQGVYAPSFHRELPTRLGVIGRRGDTVTWFEADPTYVLHWVNAYEDGDEIVLDGFFQDDPMPAVGPDATYYERISRFLSLDGMQTHLHRWRLNLVTGAVKEERLSDTITEFGMINGLHGGRRHRYTYAATGVPGRFQFNGLVTHDVDAGTEQAYMLPYGVYCSETAMSPRVGSTGEDDGYLVTFTIDMPQNRSQALVFDAANVVDGPLAQVTLPERISSGTHSTWAPGSALAGWRG